MTEAEWLACKDLKAMLAFFGPKRQDRKSRLFLCACARLNWALLEAASRRVVETAERYADGEADADERLRVTVSASHFTSHDSAVYRAARLAWAAGRGNAARGLHWQFEQGPDPRLCDLLREVVGNPFRPVHLELRWLLWNDRCVPRMAEAIYRDRQLPRGALGGPQFAVLGDALEEAGCTNTDVLNHCRLPAEHVRGCWVLDLILGRH
jgi:hypothetical protein